VVASSPVKPRLNRHSAPEYEGGEIEAGEVVLGDAVVSGGDATELLQSADGALDAVSELVFARIEGAFARHAGALRDDRLCAGRLDMVEDGVPVIGLVGKDVGGIETGQ
jgi:hypothetical protein